MTAARGYGAIGVLATAVLTGCSTEIEGTAGPAPLPGLADEGRPPGSEGNYSVTVLSSDAVERAITEQYGQQYGTTLAGLDCPDDMVVSVGATYECSGTEVGSGDVVITIEVTDDAGSYTWAAAD